MHDRISATRTAARELVRKREVLAMLQRSQERIWSMFGRRTDERLWRMTALLLVSLRDLLARADGRGVDREAMAADALSRALTAIEEVRRRCADADRARAREA